MREREEKRETEKKEREGESEKEKIPPHALPSPCGHLRGLGGWGEEGALVDLAGSTRPRGALL